MRYIVAVNGEKNGSVCVSIESLVRSLRKIESCHLLDQSRSYLLKRIEISLEAPLSRDRIDLTIVSIETLMDYFADTISIKLLVTYRFDTFLIITKKR